MKKIAVIGECMVEFYQEQTGLYKMGFAGDTLNFAIYCKRQLPKSIIEYITVTGNDKLSNNMLNFFSTNNIGYSFVDKLDNKTIGLFIIDTINGERSFSYWRDSSAAKELFTTKSRALINKKILNYDLIYYSAITLAIMSSQGRDSLFKTIKEARENGVKVAFDSNYRKILYASSNMAKKLYTEALKNCDIFLPSMEDEVDLWEDKDHTDVINRATSLGCNEIVIKNGGDSVIYYKANITARVKTTKINKVIDTTSAGDSFNAAYLASRLDGNNIIKSIESAQQLSSQVIMHQGAIIPTNKNKQL